MYLVALTAIHEAGVSTPYGMHHCVAVEPECEKPALGRNRAAPKGLAPERALMAR